MSIDEKKMANDEVLENISGGKMASDDLGRKRAEFEKAWDLLGMDAKGYSGMRMAAIFDDWELAGYKPGAVAFLKAQEL